MIKGGCICGKIRYELHGKLSNARSCHCSICRKTFSSQASAYAEVDHRDFKWVKGEEQLTTFKTQEDYGLCFCKVCGSTLGGVFMDKIHGLTLGCVDGDPDIKFEMHIYTDSKANWETLPSDNVPKYSEGPKP